MSGEKINQKAVRRFWDDIKWQLLGVISDCFSIVSEIALSHYCRSMFWNDALRNDYKDTEMKETTLTWYYQMTKKKFHHRNIIIMTQNDTKQQFISKC